MSRTFRLKGFKNPWSHLGHPDWVYHGDFVSFWGRKAKAMLKKLTARKSRREPIMYDVNTDEQTTKYHLNEDPWGWD